MCQGGAFSAGHDTGKELIYGVKFANENFVMKHDELGILSMDNFWPWTNISQFFICTEKSEWLTGKHVVFGQVVDGMDVVRAIVKVGYGFKPVVVAADCETNGFRTKSRGSS
ncbi:Peptidyl-prolyl cis-trans isomerase 1 [Linum perenne]